MPQSEYLRETLPLSILFHHGRDDNGEIHGSLDRLESPYLSVTHVWNRLGESHPFSGRLPVDFISMGVCAP